MHNRRIPKPQNRNTLVKVYDDRVQELLAINKKAKVDHLLFGKILTLHEIDGGSGHSIRIPSGFVHHAKKSVLKRTLFFFLSGFLLRSQNPRLSR